MKEQFTTRFRLTEDNKIILDKAIDVIEDYESKGYSLTLRQLYYQMITINAFPNTLEWYKKFGDMINRAKYLGEIDWDTIEDRGRLPQLPYLADSISEAIKDIRNAYQVNRLSNQDVYIETWIEKDALSGVFYDVTAKYSMVLMANRGYSSGSAMYRAYRRMMEQMQEGKKIYVLYFGDHDPSGLDMIRDVKERMLEMLCNSSDLEHWFYLKDDEEIQEYLNEYYDEYSRNKDFLIKSTENKGTYYLNVFKIWVHKNFEVIPVALNQEQIKQYGPPENPAKVTDPRAGEYIKKFGRKSWELDALPPNVLRDMLQEKINELIDEDKFEDMRSKELDDKETLDELVEKENNARKEVIHNSNRSILWSRW